MGLSTPTAAVYPNDALLEDLSRQMMFSSRRYSRGSNGQRHTNSMRVVKPRSANTSPQSSVLQQRKRTMMGDSVVSIGKQQHFEPPYLPTPGMEACYGAVPEPPKKSARPLSWHPSSYVPQSQLQLAPPTPAAGYPFPTYNELDFVGSQQFPPTPAAYSAYTSPSTAFSPLSLPYSGYEASQYFPPGSWAASASGLAATDSRIGSLVPNSEPLQPLDYGLPAQPSAAWNTIAPNPFNNFTAPPTPENFPLAQQPQPTISAEESIPYQPLDDDGSGEVLVGMGLYDTPEKDMDLFHSTVSQLLGSPCYPEPTGKGLKLEDAWEPPAQEDEDEDDDDEDEDAEGEEQEE